MKCPDPDDSDSNVIQQVSCQFEIGLLDEGINTKQYNCNPGDPEHDSSEGCVCRQENSKSKDEKSDFQLEKIFLFPFPKEVHGDPGQEKDCVA